MIPLFILSCLSAFFRSRYNLALEILALRQQLGVLKRKRPHPRLRIQDRIFWTLLRRLMACMEPRPGYRQTRNRGRLASLWLSFILAPSVEAKDPWQAKARCRG